MRIERKAALGTATLLAATLAVAYSQAGKLEGLNSAQPDAGKPEKAVSALGQPAYLNEGELRAVMPAQLNAPLGAPAEAPAKAPAEAPKKDGGVPPQQPTPDVTITTPSGVCVDKVLGKGESFRAPANSIVQGDVLVDGVRYFDNSEKTGLIIQLEREANIDAPFGADVICAGPDELTRQRTMGQAVEEMKAKGCVNGCDRVEVVKIAPGAVVSAPRAGATPIPPSAPSIGPAAGCSDRSIGKGEILHVDQNSLVQGDVAVNGRKLFDDKDTTGLLVVVDTPGGADINAPFGASVNCPVSDQGEREKLIQQTVNQLKVAGCGPSGCKQVDVITVSSGKKQ